jgi:hypothetical protein
MIFNAGTIVALIFVVLSIAALLAITYNGKGFFQSPFRKFMIAATGVYVSGTVLVALLYVFRNDLPSMFVFVAEALMLVVFIITVWAIDAFGKKMDSMKKDPEAKKVEETPEEDI